MTAVPQEVVNQLETILSTLSKDNVLRGIKEKLVLHLIEQCKHFGGLTPLVADAGAGAPSASAPAPIAATLRECFPKFKQLLQRLRMLLVDGDRPVRNAALRSLRYVVTDAPGLRIMLALNMDIFVARALELEPKLVWERTQALKVIRSMMAIDALQMTHVVVQSLLAVAETAKDDLRRPCLDTLRELVLMNPAIVASCNGIKTLVSAILDSECQDIAGSLTLTVLYLLDHSATRKYLRPHVEIQKLFAVFTDTSTPNSRPKEVKRAAAHKALVTIMRSWTGILCLTSNPQGLRSLVELLALPPTVKGSAWAKEAIFDLIFEVLHVVQSQDLRSAKEKDLWDAVGPNLLHSYIVVVLFAFMNCGLIETLTDLAMSGDAEFSGVAQSLLTEILRLSADLFPPKLCAKLNALPSVISSAMAFDLADSWRRFRAVTMLRDLRELSTSLQGRIYSENEDNKVAMTDKNSTALSRFKQQFIERKNQRRRMSLAHGMNIDEIAYQTDPIAFDAYGKASWRFTDQTDHNTRIIDKLRAGVEAQMDELELTAMLKRTQVLNTKNFKEWDMNAVLEVLEGPLSCPRLVTLALNTKFCKRLLSFLRPEKNFFADLDWTTENMVYVRMATRLFRVLLDTREGSDYAFFVQLVDSIFTTILKEIGKYTGEESKEGSRGTSVSHFRPLNREHVCTKLSREYFTLVGILSSSERGLTFFDKHNIYDNLYKLIEDESRDYITRLLIANLDYGCNKRARTLLETWVKNGSVTLRRFTLSHLRLLLRRNVADFWQWGIGLLVNQLQYNDPTVASMALNVLEEACADPENLDTLIKKRPSFNMVGARGNNLQTTMLSTSNGVDYLQKNNWIFPMLDKWRNAGNQKYVEGLEHALVSALNTGSNSGSGEDSANAFNPEDSPDGGSSHGTAGSNMNLAGADAVTLQPMTEPLAVVDSAAGFVGGFGGFGGFRTWHAALRSAEDEYYFDRIHHLPWTVNVSLEYPHGRKMQILSETYVHTVPRSSDDDDGLVTYVVANILDYDGKPKPYRIDPTVSIRALLNVGPSKGKDREVNSVLSLPEDRARVTDETPIVAQSLVRWHFVSELPGGGDPKESPLSPRAGRTLGRSIAPSAVDLKAPGRPLYLAAVWFQIPTPSNSNAIVTLAPHLYGELAKTDEGVELLRASGHVKEFAQVIKSISLDAMDDSADGKAVDDAKRSALPTPLEQRAALWAVGQIGSSSRGFELVKELELVDFISTQAKFCTTLSMRGTCFYILGLLSRSTKGRATLKELGWEFSVHPEAGVVLPSNIKDFMKLPETTYVGSWAEDPRNVHAVTYVPMKVKGTAPPPGTNDAKIVLGHISNLSNNVSQKSSLQTLRQMMGTHRELFESPLLFFETCKLLATYTFRLPARRFILFELFAKVKFTEESIEVFDQPYDKVQDDALNRLTARNSAR